MPLDTLRSLGARMFLNKNFADFGEVIDASIDPKTSVAALLVQLKGESAPLRLEVDYRLDADAIVTLQFRCEREWVAVALNRFLAGHRFGIDNSLAQTLLGILL